MTATVERGRDARRKCRSVRDPPRDPSLLSRVRIKTPCREAWASMVGDDTDVREDLASLEARVSRLADAVYARRVVEAPADLGHTMGSPE